MAPVVAVSMTEIFDSTPVSDSEENLPEEAPTRFFAYKVSDAALNEIYDATPVSDAEENLPNEKAADNTKAVPGIQNSSGSSVQMAMKLISSAQQILSGGKR